MPLIRAQKESRLDPPSGCGGFKFIPCFLAEARPLAFRPPLGFLPSLRVHAADLAIEHRDTRNGTNAKSEVQPRRSQNTFAGDLNVKSIWITVAS